MGHHSFRAGYAGEDTPKTEIPSYVGVTELETPMDIDGSNGNGLLGGDVKQMGKKYTIDTVNVHVPKAGKIKYVSYLKSIVLNVIIKTIVLFVIKILTNGICVCADRDGSSSVSERWPSGRLGHV